MTVITMNQMEIALCVNGHIGGDKMGVRTWFRSDVSYE